MNTVTELPWFMKGCDGEYLRDCVEHRLYILENPDWRGLADDAKNYGLNTSEVFEFLTIVREEG